MYTSLLGTSKSVGKPSIYCRLQDVRVPTLGALQHEGKSAHILRSIAGQMTLSASQAGR